MTDKDLMALVAKDHLKDDRQAFKIGDTIEVHVKIVEGEKQRIQLFTGTAIAKSGSDINASFTVRRLVGSMGVERVFPLHSPSIEKIIVKRHGKVRRAKLYYLRDRIGKATRVAEKRPLASEPQAPAPEAKAEPAAPESAE